MKGGYELFYSKIKELCEKKGISVRKFETDLGFSRGCACKWESSMPSFDKIVLIADYFNISLDELKKVVIAKTA